MKSLLNCDGWPIYLVPIKNKKLQAYKPDSVPAVAGCYHLSAMAVTSHLYLPTQDHATQKSVDEDEPPFDDPLHGISAYKVYPL